MKLAIVTDTWKPQLNGVVRILTMLENYLQRAGYDPVLFTPEFFRTVGCPTYPEVRLSIGVLCKLERKLAALQPDMIHIATEGPLGLAARSICIHKGWRFTTAFHTKLPEYIYARCRIPPAWTYACLRRFHSRSAAVMVGTDTVRRELLRRGFDRVVVCTPGVDTEFFDRRRTSTIEIPRPVFLYVGRIAVEKNIPAFLSLDLPGSKLVVGDGPLLEKFRRAYPEVHFAGAREGEELVRYYASADVLIFPSRTETFGLVLVEALSCGVPIAAFPSAGPTDVVGCSKAGILDFDLRKAALDALLIPRDSCRNHAMTFRWERAAQEFMSHLVSR